MAFEHYTTTSKKKIKYINVPCSFDIETSSFYDKGKKRAIMYEWTLCLNGVCIIGRRWEELHECIEFISEYLELRKGKMLVIYVHNLAFEFGFIKDRFKWEKVFALDSRKPCYAIADCGIEFRCSYILSGLPLEKLAEDVQSIQVKKLVGNLDYDLMRHSKTELSQEEIDYCINDCRVVVGYIQDEINRNGDITNIPLTKTGYVRRYVKNACLNEHGIPKKKSKKFWNYRNLMQALTIEPDEYEAMKRAFQGGFTHANPAKAGIVLENVASYDFTSSYPTIICSEPQFPMSKGKKVHPKNWQEMKHYLDCYACIFDIRFKGLTPKHIFDNYISVSRCWELEKPNASNGRLISADLCSTTITNFDFTIIYNMYHWEEMEIGDFYIYRRGYLPRDIIDSVLTFYEEKTKFKGIPEKLIEYNSAKANANSIFGMMVTDIVRPEHTYSDEWTCEIPILSEVLEKYNANYGRFTFYAWGIFITAIARYNLFTGIMECKDDYCYSDTDSVKILNHEKHKEYFDTYNKWVTDKLEAMCDFYHFDKSRIRPKTVEGIEKPLGVWDFEGVYSRFKTLGAKRYLVEKNGKIEITIAGLGKKKGGEFIKSRKNPFDFFSDGMQIPAEHTGKLTHTYIEEPYSGVVTDYQGNKCRYAEKSGVHLEKTPFELSMTREFLDYIEIIRKEVGY